MVTALTIAGSDPSGGAGIEADIKTMTANGVYAMTAITALTAQNTLGVYAAQLTKAEFLEKQLDCIFSDIVPDAVKIGMVADASLIAVIKDRLKKYRAAHVVVDPVMVSTSGSKLLPDEAIAVLKEELFPLAEIVTPNIAEAQVLSGVKIHGKKDMENAAQIIGRKANCHVLLKGGHLCDCADDCLWKKNGSVVWYAAKRIDNPNTHGTGCTLSAAIAANLAKGMFPEQAVGQAKVYVNGAIAQNLHLGHGHGPLDHTYLIPAFPAKI